MLSIRPQPRLRDRLQTRLLVAFIAVAAAGSLPLTGIVAWQAERRLAAEAASEGHDLATAAANVLESETSRLELALRSLRSFPVLLKAVAEQDRAAVADRMARAHAQLSPSGVTALVVTTPDMRVLYRSDAPNDFGDNVGGRRPDLATVQSTGAAVSSFAQTRDSLSMVRALPLELDGKRVGVLSARVNFTQAFYDRLRASMGAEIVVHVPDGAGIRTLGGAVGDGAVGSGTVGGGSAGAVTGLDRAGFDRTFTGASAPYDGRIGTHSAVGVTIPVRDAAGKPLAVIEVLRDRAARLAADRVTLWTLLGTGLGVITIAALLGAALSRSIVKPLRRTIDAAGLMVRGDTDAVVPGIERGGELGDLARALDVLRQGARQVAVLQQERDAARLVDAASRRALLQRLGDEAQGQVGAVADAIAHAAMNLTDAAQDMTAKVAEAGSRSGQAGEAGAVAHSNVQAVAAAAEELNASVSEIARRVQDQTDLTRQAQNQAGRSVEACDSMTAAAKHVEGIVGLIGDIAARTNLLALNATIEAARAGEAGRGFVVVASEVKNLAAQTAAATSEIGDKIAQMQSAATANAMELQGIGDTVGKLDAIAGSIAAAVQQQSAATAEIARAVDSAARQTETACTAIEGTARTAAGAGVTCEAVTEASTDLSMQSGRLHQAMARFLSGLQTETQAA